jgi:hypothetical protein
MIVMMMKKIDDDHDNDKISLRVFATQTIGTCKCICIFTLSSRRLFELSIINNNQLQSLLTLYALVRKSDTNRSQHLNTESSSDQQFAFVTKI